MKKLLSLLLALTLTAAMFTGCGADKPAKSNGITVLDSDKVVTMGNANSDGSYNISFVDDEGYTIKMEKPAERIMSLYSAHTENLYELGAGDQIIGGYTTCIYPAEAAPKAKYSYKGDVEHVIAAEPDLVIIRPFITRKSPDFVKSLREIGIPVVSLYPESYDAFDDYILKLAMLSGKTEEAVKELAEFHSDIETIHEKTKDIENKERVFFEATEVNLRTASEGSMPDLAITFAGGINAADNISSIRDGGTISDFGVERILEKADSIDVYVSQRGSMNSGGNLKTISERPGFETIKAVKDGKVFVINEKIISSPTFRYYKGIKELARYMYPDVMDTIDEYKNDEPATRRSFANILVKVLHKPIYLPTSSKYYNQEHRGHIFGMFEDINWLDDDFDYIETAVNAGLVSWEKAEDGKEYFRPDMKITRDELAKAVFLAGDFKSTEGTTAIKDIADCESPRMIQTLVDSGVFELIDGSFMPEKEVTNNEILEALSFVA